MVTMVRKKEHGQIGDHGAKRTWTEWRPWYKKDMETTEAMVQKKVDKMAVLVQK